jgi:hypothetical protein
MAVCAKLAKSVAAVYVEATAEETEARLLKALRRSALELAPASAVREGTPLAACQAASKRLHNGLRRKPTETGRESSVLGSWLIAFLLSPTGRGSAQAFGPSLGDMPIAFEILPRLRGKAQD